jgi:TIR domain
MDPKSDFFISYSGADRAWAEWIAWQLEANGYTTVLQAWDFIPGRDFGHLTQQAMDTAKRTIVVLSPAYVASMFGEAEWRPAFAEDPAGQLGLLVAVRVAEVTPPGLLATRIFIDLVGVTDEQEAIDRLLQGLSEQRVKPSQLDGGICDACIELPMPVGPVEGKPRPWLPELELLPHFGVTTSAQVGRWEVRAEPAGVLAVHAALLRTGKVVYFGGRKMSSASTIPAGRASTTPACGIRRPSPRRPTTTCSAAGTRCSPTGGCSRRAGRRSGPADRSAADPTTTLPWGISVAWRPATAFDPGFAAGTNPWSSVKRMNFQRGTGQGGGRWYPTLVTLPDGRVLAMSGHPEDSDTRHHTITIEAFSPTPAPQGDWSDEGDQLLVLDSYPRLHIIPGGAQGKLLCTTLNDGQSWTWDPAARPGPRSQPVPAPTTLATNPSSASRAARRSCHQA